MNSAQSPIRDYTPKTSDEEDARNHQHLHKKTRYEYHDEYQGQNPMQDPCSGRSWKSGLSATLTALQPREEQKGLLHLPGLGWGATMKTHVRISHNMNTTIQNENDTDNQCLSFPTHANRESREQMILSNRNCLAMFEGCPELRADAGGNDTGRRLLRSLDLWLALGRPDPVFGLIQGLRSEWVPVFEDWVLALVLEFISD